MKHNNLSSLAHSAVSSFVNILSDAFASLGRALISLSLVSLAVLSAAWSALPASALVGGVLLCLSPIAARGQSVSFAGWQSVLPNPSSALAAPPQPQGIAVDSAGDVFVCESGDNIVVELLKTASGFEPPIILPFVGLSSGTIGVAVDSAGICSATTLTITECWNCRGQGPATERR